jgi:hypothetical protein
MVKSIVIIGLQEHIVKYYQAFLPFYKTIPVE